MLNMKRIKTTYNNSHQKDDVLGVITSKQLFDMKKPKYNGFACGYGPHGDNKYHRKKINRILNKYDNI